MIRLLYPSSKRSNSKFQCSISVLRVNCYLWHKREWSIFKCPHPVWLAREERFGDGLKRLPKVTWQLQAFVSVSLLHWAFLREIFVFWHYAALCNDSRYFQKRLNHTEDVLHIKQPPPPVKIKISKVVPGPWPVLQDQSPGQPNLLRHTGKDSWEQTVPRAPARPLLPWLTHPSRGREIHPRIRF